MADFDVVLSGSAVVAAFEDDERAPGTLGPDDKGAPSRLNATTGHPHLQQRATVGGTVIVTAEGGATDVALGGRSFVGHFAEIPTGIPAPSIIFVPGTSSVQSWAVPVIGHYTFVMTFDGGKSGRMAIHVDAE